MSSDPSTAQSHSGVGPADSQATTNPTIDTTSTFSSLSMKSPEPSSVAASAITDHGRSDRTPCLTNLTRFLKTLESSILGYSDEEKAHWSSHRDALCKAFGRLIAAQNDLGNLERPEGRKGRPNVPIDWKTDARALLVQNLIKRTDQAIAEYYRFSNCNHPEDNLRPENCRQTGKQPKRTWAFYVAIGNQIHLCGLILSDAREVSLNIVGTMKLQDHITANKEKEFALIYPEELFPPCGTPLLPTTEG
jgi:hypothetical protein